MGDTMVRVLASTQCGPGLNSGPGILCGLILLLIIIHAEGEGFLSVLQFFPCTKANAGADLGGWCRRHAPPPPPLTG